MSIDRHDRDDGLQRLEDSVRDLLRGRLPTKVGRSVLSLEEDSVDGGVDSSGGLDEVKGGEQERSGSAGQRAALYFVR